MKGGFLGWLLAAAAVISACLLVVQTAFFLDDVTCNARLVVESEPAGWSTWQPAPREEIEALGLASKHYRPGPSVGITSKGACPVEGIAVDRVAVCRATKLEIRAQGNTSVVVATADGTRRFLSTFRRERDFGVTLARLRNTDGAISVGLLAANFGVLAILALFFRRMRAPPDQPRRAEEQAILGLALAGGTTLATLMGWLVVAVSHGGEDMVTSTPASWFLETRRSDDPGPDWCADVQ
jgi:hypothetical protein